MPKWLIWLGYSGYAALMIINAYIFYKVGRKAEQGRQIDILTAKWQAEDRETIRADGPRMANAEHRLDQAYDAISAMLWLQYQHWPLTEGEKASLLPPIMHKTFTRVEEWKEKQTEGVKY